MTVRSPQNIAASVHQRLLNKAKSDKQPFTEKSTQWKAFRKRLKQETVPTAFADVAGQVISFLDPVAESIRSGNPPPAIWKAPGPWRKDPL